MTRHLLLLLILAGASAAQDVTLAATTSVSASGLLAAVLPAFEAKTKLKVQVLTADGPAVLDLKAEILISSAPSAEQALLASGKAAGLQKLMTAARDIVGTPTKAGDPFSVTLIRVPAAEWKRGRAADKLNDFLRGKEGRALIAAHGAFAPFQAAPMLCPPVRR